MAALQIESLKERAYARLKGEILHGRLAPGARIRERAIAGRFGFSRTPVREALLHLASEGLVVFSRSRRATVSHRSVEEIEEIYTLLGLLEGFAVRRAVRRIGESELRTMAGLTVQLEEAARHGDTRKFFKINQQIHETLLSACDSPRLSAICAKLREQLQQYPVQMSSVPGWMAKSVREHREILRAVQRRRASGIEQMIRRHWRFKVPRSRILQTLAAVDGQKAGSEISGSRSSRQEGP